MRSKKTDNHANKISRGARRPSTSNYLEIFIAQDGAIILTPVTNRTKAVVEKISGRIKEMDNVYCG